MNSEILKIQQMVADGKISPEEGTRLIQSLYDGDLRNKSETHTNSQVSTLSNISTARGCLLIGIGSFIVIALIKLIFLLFDKAFQ
jgi:polyhydroxyalkanoate synthesis regulator phasin